MKKGIKVIAYTIGLSLLMVMIVICSLQQSASEAPKIVYQANNYYEETIVVVADEAYPPYSFYNDEGEIEGYDIEVLNALANEMEVNIDLRLLPWEDAKLAMEKKEADLILGLEFNEYYEERYNLSETVGVNQFVVFGKEEYNSILELYNKRVAALNNSISKEIFIDPMNFEDVTMFDYYEVAFQAILDDEIDYVIGRYAVGNRVLAQEGISEITIKGSALTSNAFCFGTQKENEELLIKLNIAIHSVNGKGIMDELTGKWLGGFTSSISVESFLKQHIDEFIFAIFIVFSLIVSVAILLVRKFQGKSNRDLATGVYNKKTVERLIQMKIGKNSYAKGALFLVDIDGLKEINDTYGHMIGDRCILNIAQILLALFSEQAIIGRIGGDEFILYFKEGKAVTNPTKLAEKIVNEVAYHNQLNENSVEYHVSIGVAIRQSQVHFETLYKQADKALYEAKANGKNQIQVYEEELMYKMDV